MCQPGFFYLDEGNPQGLLQQLTLSQVFWTSWGLEEGTCFLDKSELFQLQPGMACTTAAHLPPPTPVFHTGPLGLPQLQSTRGVEQDWLWMGKCGKQREYNFSHAGATRTTLGGGGVLFSLRPVGCQNFCSLLSTIDLFPFILCGTLKKKLYVVHVFAQCDMYSLVCLSMCLVNHFVYTVLKKCMERKY